METWSEPPKFTNYWLQFKWVTDSVFCIFYFLLYMTLILLWFPIKHTYIIETRSFSIYRVFKIYFALEQRVIWYLKHLYHIYLVPAFYVLIIHLKYLMNTGPIIEVITAKLEICRWSWERRKESDLSKIEYCKYMKNV